MAGEVSEVVVGDRLGIGRSQAILCEGAGGYLEKLIIWKYCWITDCEVL